MGRLLRTSARDDKRRAIVAGLATAAMLALGAGPSAHAVIDLTLHDVLDPDAVTVSQMRGQYDRGTGNTVYRIVVDNGSQPLAGLTYLAITDISNPAVVVANADDFSANLPAVPVFLLADLKALETRTVAMEVVGRPRFTFATAVYRDTTAPALTVPSSTTIAASDPTGSPVDHAGVAAFLSEAVALDAVDGQVVVTHDAPAFLPLGETLVTFLATDSSGNSMSAVVALRVEDQTPPTVAVTSPSPLAVLAQTHVDVAGTVSEAATVTVNGQSASVAGFEWSASIVLHEGGNVVAVVATDTAGNIGVSSISLTVDTTPPAVTIDSPGNGAETTADSVDVAGMINDIVVGTVNQAQAEVTVNGIAAMVANRGFVATGVPLALGLNNIVATGRDRAGNQATTSITVLRRAADASPALAAVSGSNQAATIATPLPLPLVVALTNADGSPAAAVSVVFRVTRNDGRVSDGVRAARALVIPTDAVGAARATHTLGGRAGAGSDRVTATATGFAGEAVFIASATATPAARIVVDTGNNQTGIPGQALALPFVSVVTDDRQNRLANVPVIFTVVAGGGGFGTESTSLVTTDSDGRAQAFLVLGPNDGVANNVVEADFAGNPGLPSVFSASGRAPGDPLLTRIVGVVLDNSDQPVPGVTMRIDGSPLETVSDSQGRFELQPAPVGHVLLTADGSTALRPGKWPILHYELVTVPGRVNTLGMPIYLLALEEVDVLSVSSSAGGSLTLPDLPGFSLHVAPGTATFPDGGDSGTVSVTPVHAEKVPMVPTFGQQPRLVVTIQPPGVRFEPPAPVQFPNVDGLAPGEVTELFSFDHDLGQFVAIGTGTVSEDASVVRSDPGVGIVKAGWHLSANRPQPTASVCNCSQCEECVRGACMAKPNGTLCDDGNACTKNNVCNAGQCGGEPAMKVNGPTGDRRSWLELLDKCKDSSILQEQCLDPDIGNLEVNVGRSRGVVCDGVGVNVIFDTFCTKDIDLNDLEAADRLRPCEWATDSCQVVLHFLGEQFSGQLGNTYEQAHAFGHTLENAYREEKNRPGRILGCFGLDNVMECKYDDNADGIADRQVIWNLDSFGDVTSARCVP